MLKETKDLTEFMTAAANGSQAFILYSRDNGEPALLDFGTLVTKRLGLLNAKYICDATEESGKDKEKDGRKKDKAGKKKAKSDKKGAKEPDPSGKAAERGNTAAEGDRPESTDAPVKASEPGQGSAGTKKQGTRKYKIDRDRVIELRKQGKTVGEIADSVEASVPGVSAVIKELKDAGKL